MTAEPANGPPATPISVESSRGHSHRLTSAIAHVARAPFLATVTSTTDTGADPGPVPAEPLLKKALASLELSGRERVLELGSRTGYETALLSRLAERIISLVPDDRTATTRAALLRSVGCENVEVVVGQGPSGWPGAAPYAAIFVASGATHVPAALLDQLDVGGRLVIPLGDASGQVLELLRHQPDGCPSQTLGCCHLAMLPWASRRTSSFPWTPEGTAARDE